MASQLLGSVGHRRPRPRRARVHVRQPAHAAPTASAGWSRTRWASRSRCATRSRSQPGHTVRLTLDANLQDRAEEVLNEVGKKWKPKGATAIVMDPNSGAILALANWPRVNANALDEAPEYARAEPRDRHQLRAGLDLQGVHRRRRAGGRQGHAGHEVRHPADPPGRRPRDQGRRGARLGDDDHAARSSSTPRTSARC